MKKLLCVIPALLLFAMIGAPSARADSYTPVFTCAMSNGGGGGGCIRVLNDPPTAPDVSFPGPVTLAVTLYPSEFGTPASPVFDVTLPAQDSPTDQYFWNNSISGFDGPPGNETTTFSIGDVNTGLGGEATLPGGFGNPDTTPFGSLTFVPVSAATPEPMPVILMLLGGGLIFFMRKRFIMHTPRTA